MDKTQVVIIGAGPSGLALGLALAKLQIRSVILEKERDVTSDPRGVYLTGDAVRMLYDLGIGHKMEEISHDVHTVNFHQSNFNTKPFFVLNIGTTNALQQAVPEGVLQIQPRLEYALRSEVERSEWSTLQTGCQVVGITGGDAPIAEYVDEHDASRRITGQWLVGADGKVGIVRKHFLEPTAGIRQETGTYSYEGTWIASNLKLSVPTPQTHPDFPLWGLGYSPEEVYDLFWPKGWHFCSPPGKPTATGRFGPYSERLWRHEFRQDTWEDSMDAESLFWDHIIPMITLAQDGQRLKFPSPVQYPQNCIEVLRCRPFKFAHKVVNRWFHQRVILIGDAAHVFPPFAGQGIASGIRDAHQLAWRLAFLLRSNLSPDQHRASSNALLKAWSLERRKSVDDAAFFSMLNGRLCNHQPPFWLLCILGLQMFLESATYLPSFPDPQALKERQGICSVKSGFFLPRYNGGARMAQVHVRSSLGNDTFLSDNLLCRKKNLFTLLVISNDDDHATVYAAVKTLIEAATIDPVVVSEESIIILKPFPRTALSQRTSDNGHDKVECFLVVDLSKRPESRVQDCAGISYIDRLGRSTKFVIVRPDFFVFACAKDLPDLGKCLQMLKIQLYNGQ